MKLHVKSCSWSYYYIPGMYTSYTVTSTQNLFELYSHCDIQQTHSLVFFLVCSPAPNLVTKMFVMRLYTEFFLPYKLTLKGIVDITHL